MRLDLQAAMSSATLLAAGGVALAVAAVYAHMGRRVLQRNGSSRGSARAMHAFAPWWGALAANMLLGGLFMLGAALGWQDLGLQVGYAVFQRFLLVLSLVGLMGYLLYLLTGRDLLAPLAVAYAGFFVFLLAAMLLSQPTGVYIGEWRTDLLYAGSAPRWMQVVNLAALLGPPVGGALAYFRLYFRLHDPTQRYRIALVSWALIAWWVVAVMAGQHEMFGSQGFQVVNRFLGLGAALVILAAFEPPGWARRRWGVRPFAEGPAPRVA